MAAGAITRTLRNPGRLVVDPTDLSTTYPYGGTEVGLTNQATISVLSDEPVRVWSEGLGEVTDVLEPNKRFAFSALLRGWDHDAVETLFPRNYTAGTTSPNHAIYSEPGSRTPGQSAVGRAVILLFVPDDLLHGKAVLCYSAVPEWTPGAEVVFQRSEEVILPVVADCLRDANDNILAVGTFADLSLS